MALYTGNWSYNPTYRSYNPIYNWKGAHLVYIYIYKVGPLPVINGIMTL